MTALSKSISLFLLLIATSIKLSAQSTASEKATHAVAIKTITFLNKKMPDSIYPMASESLRNAISPALWMNMYRKELLPLLPFQEMAFISSKDSISKYKLQSKVPLVLYIRLDKSGKVNYLAFQPFQRETGPSGMTLTERQTDTVARKVIKLVNEKKADSVYLLAGDQFKQQLSPSIWKNALETSIFPLTPFSELVFVGSKQGINKYKSNQFQVLVGIDQQKKMSAFLIQPYQEELTDFKVSSDNPLKSRLDSLIHSILLPYMKTKGNVGVSIGIFYRGKDYYFNYGERREGSAELPTRHTLYDIGSITKTFTATLLAMAVNQGKVKLSTPITSLLPDSVSKNPALKGITLMQLANHTSGMPRLPDNLQRTVTDPDQPYANYKVTDLFSFLKRAKPVRESGIEYEYSNLGVALLGVLFERMYDKPYAELIDQFITGPAKMTQTHLALKGNDTLLVAQGYSEMHLPVKPWTFLSMAGAGAIKSSASNLLSYGKLQLSVDATPLSKAMKLTHDVTYHQGQDLLGLGWHFLDGNAKVLQHSGATGGYRSLLAADLENNLVVAVLTNNASQGIDLGVRLTKALRAAMR